MKTLLTLIILITSLYSYGLSEVELKKELKKYGVKYIDVAIAQAKIETANFTSNIFKECNNLFGMHHPRIRKTTAIGYYKCKDGRVAKYLNWQSSVADYLLWQNYQENHHLKNKESYIKHLGRVYSVTNYYEMLIRKMIKNE